MTTGADISGAMKRLPKRELSQCRKWFVEYDAALWDRQIDADFKAGELDALTMRRLIVIVSVALLVPGCNAPPMYESNAREFLRAQGVEAELVEKLSNYTALTPDEVLRLQVYENVAVKHLLGSNLGTDPELLTALAKHPDLEVRTGVASNPKAPMTVLLSLRSPGRYTTVNAVLSGNPMLPQTLLREMYSNGETTSVSLASNPNLPEDMMRAIDKAGGYLEIPTLARNPALPRDLLDKYLADQSEMVRGSAQSNPQINPRYKRPQDDMLGGR